MNTCFLFNGETLHLEFPSLARKYEAMEFIREFKHDNSTIHGDGSLNSYLANSTYEEWLDFVVNLSKGDYNNYVKAKTYFLVRSDDDKIVGIINLRFKLNDYLREFGGHIGYSIRPLERKKGYNKVNTYLALNIYLNEGFEELLITCDKSNDASRKTIEFFDSKFIRTAYDESDNTNTNVYSINIQDAITKFEKTYN